MGRRGDDFGLLRLNLSHKRHFIPLLSFVKLIYDQLLVYFAPHGLRALPVTDKAAPGRSVLGLCGPNTRRSAALLYLTPSATDISP